MIYGTSITNLAKWQAGSIAPNARSAHLAGWQGRILRRAFALWQADHHAGLRRTTATARHGPGAGNRLPARVAAGQRVGVISGQALLPRWGAALTALR